MNGSRNPEEDSVNAKKPIMKRLALDKMVLEPFQREVKAAKVAKIVKGYEQALDIPIEVADLENGFWSILDGQHRRAALIQRGESDALGRVHFGLSYEERADLFNRFQTERTAISRLAQHHANVEAKKRDALALDLLVREEGFRITAHNVHGGLKGVKALEDSYAKYGEGPLRRALKTIAAAWGRDDTAALKAPVVYGMTYLFEKHPGLDHARCVKRFGSKLPMHISASAAANYKLSVSGAGRAWMMVARELLAIYNDGLRDNRVDSRLDP